MRSLRVAAVLIAVYGLMVLLNAAALGRSSGDMSQFLPRALLRAVGAVLIAAGLWQRARWAWVFGTILSGLLGLLGLLVIIALYSRGILSSLLNQRLHLPFLILGGASLLGAFILLLSPAARTSVKRVSKRSDADVPSA